jgi:hypothetical protein
MVPRPCGFEVMFRRKVDWLEITRIQPLGQPIKPRDFRAKQQDFDPHEQ